MNYEVKGAPEAQASLFTAINKCQSDFPEVPTNGTGQAGPRRFKYATLEDIIASIKPQLAHYGVTFMQLLGSVDKQSSITLLVAGHGATIASSFCFQQDRNPQDAGKAITYYKRYQLTSFWGIVGDEDADSVSVEDNKRKYEEKERADKAERLATDDSNRRPPSVAKEPAGNSGAKPESEKRAKQLDEQDAAHDKAVQDEGNGLVMFPRDGDEKAANAMLTKLMKQNNWKMDNYHQLLVKHSLYPAGVDSPAKLPYASKCDLIDTVVNGKKVTG